MSFFLRENELGACDRTDRVPKLYEGRAKTSAVVSNKAYPLGSEILVTS
jgi:hypothetical protein